MTVENRFRTRGARFRTSGCTEWYYYYNGVKTMQYPCASNPKYSGYHFGKVETMNDVVDSEYWSKIQAGQMVNNPMSQTADELTGGDSGWHKTWANGSYVYHGIWAKDWLAYCKSPATHHSFTSIAESLKTEAATAARASINKQDTLLLVTAMELDKTIALLRQPLFGLRELIQKHRLQKMPRWKARKHDKDIFLVARDFADAAASSWLEMRYGWRPLMYEIQGVVQALTKEVEARRTYRATREYSTSQTTTGDITVDGIKTNTTRTTSYNVTARAGVIVDDVRTTLAGKLGLRIEDIPDSLWERLPYSFASDWFLNIGSFIATLKPNVGFKERAAWLGLRESFVTSEDINSVYITGWDSTQTGTCTGSYLRESVNYSRAPSSFGDIGIVYKYGSLREVLTDARAIDALGLLYNFARNLGSSKGLRL